MTGSMRQVRSQDGTPIAFDRSGAGPAVILVCGASTTRAANAPLAALLAPHFTVFNYDRRGRGDSGDPAPYAVEPEVEDPDALIVEAGGLASAFGTSCAAMLSLDAPALLKVRPAPRTRSYSLARGSRSSSADRAPGRAPRRRAP